MAAPVMKFARLVRWYSERFSRLAETVREITEIVLWFRGFSTRLGRFFRAELRDFSDRRREIEAPERILERTADNLQENLVTLRQAIARATAVQRQTEFHYNRQREDASKWRDRAEQARARGDEPAERIARGHLEACTEMVDILKEQLDLDTLQVETIRRNLMDCENKAFFFKAKKNLLHARVKAAASRVEIHEAFSDLLDDLERIVPRSARGKQTARDENR